VPLVALGAAATLARVEPEWGDAARMAGVGRVRVWRKFVWQIIRPSVARATATVFAMTLVEPGTPLVLGLRRTLAFQIVEAATSSDPAPRAAVLALEALGIAVVGRLLISWWGGPPELHLPATPVARSGPASWRRALGFVTLLGVIGILAWLPILALVTAGLARPSSGTGLSFIVFLRRLGDPDARRLMVNSLALGLAAVAIDLVLARLLSGLAAGRRRGLIRFLALWPEAVPPLVVGVGALVLPGLLQMGADTLRASGSRAILAWSLQTLADGLDPYRTPGVLLALGVATVWLPLVTRAVEAGRIGSRRAMIEAAITLGATPARARRLPNGGRLGASVGALALAVSLAATNLAPALILATTSESRPVSPGVLVLADQPGEGRNRAAALATCALVANITAFAWAARSRPRSIGDWFRGCP
jgi:iron(III) transport system permease protein